MNNRESSDHSEKQAEPEEQMEVKEPQEPRVDTLERKESEEMFGETEHVPKVNLTLILG